MNHVMVSGKKLLPKIVYGALEQIKKNGSANPLEVFESAIESVAPVVEVKSRRLGGDISGSCRGGLPEESPAMRWLADSARARGENLWRFGWQGS